MIDNASFVISDYSNKEFELLTDRLNVQCPLNADKVTFDLENLRINYYPNINRLRIKNSIHCYFNAVYGDLKQAVNYNDFKFSDFLTVCEGWSKIIFERPTEDFELSTNFEVGLNIDTNQHSPFDVIARYLSYATTCINEFYTCPPYNLKGKPIQRMCFLSDYKIKVYDKSRQAHLHNKNLLRYEIIYTELRKIRQILCVSKHSPISLKSLTETDTWHKLFEALIHVYDGIKMIPLLDEGLPSEHVAGIHGYCNKIMSEDLKKSLNINTYNKKRTAMKALYNSYGSIESNFHQVVKNKLINKYNSLINIQQFQSL